MAVEYIKSEEEMIRTDQAFFGPLWNHLSRDTITDIDISGNQVWITDLISGRYALSEEEIQKTGISRNFLEQFVQRTSNLVSRQFNKRNPVLEAETPELRLTIVHESAARTGRCISIRKTPPVLRLSPKNAVSSGYCSSETMAFLGNCVNADMNIIICGLPGAGKTESLKMLASFIAPEKRVVTIEDTLEIHYSQINHGADAIELKVNEQLFTYTDAIKASLRLNPTWIMLSEARSREVKHLLESWSTGVHGMTTIHSGDVRTIPDRILNMMGSRQDADRLENDIYQTMDLAIMVKKGYDDRGKIHRYLDQLCFYHRREGKNERTMAIYDGKWILAELPEYIIRRLEDYGIREPFRRKAEYEENVFGG